MSEFSGVSGRVAISAADTSAFFSAERPSVSDFGYERRHEHLEQCDVLDVTHALLSRPLSLTTRHRSSNARFNRNFPLRAAKQGLPAFTLSRLPAS